MPDPFANVQPGQPVTFSAAAWNAMLGAGRAWKNDQTGRVAGALTTSRSSALVRVRNETGLDLGRGSVVGLAGPIFTPADSEDAFLREMTFRGVVPTSSHAGRFAVLLEPAPAAGPYDIEPVVRAWVAGVCPVRVDLTDVSHDRADVTAGATGYLTSGLSGSAQILWSESEDAYSGYTTGEQWALVRLGAAGGTARNVVKVMTPLGGIPGWVSQTEQQSAVCEVYLRTPGTGEFGATGIFVDVYNPSPNAVAWNTLTTAAIVDGEYEVIVEPCVSGYY